MTGRPVRVVPMYLAVDVSYSMSFDGRIQAANRMLSELLDAVRQDPALADAVRLGLIDFSDDARVVMPLRKGSEVVPAPTLSVRGGTSFRAAFELLGSEIGKDVVALERIRTEIERPVVFFVTDGEPNAGDAWEDAFSQLVGFHASSGSRGDHCPDVVPCGVGAAKPVVLSALMYPRDGMRMVLQRHGSDSADAFSQVAGLILSRMTSTSSSDPAGAGTIARV